MHEGSSGGDGNVATIGSDRPRGDTAAIHLDLIAGSDVDVTGKTTARELLAS